MCLTQPFLYKYFIICVIALFGYYKTFIALTYVIFFRIFKYEISDNSFLDLDFIKTSMSSGSEHEDNNVVEGEIDETADEQNSIFKRNLPRTRRNREQNKRSRMHGEEYLGFKRDGDGHLKLMAPKNARSVKPRCNSQKCIASKYSRFCPEFTEDERKEIFKLFWELTWDKKKSFLSTMVELIPSKRRIEGSRRSGTLHYYLEKGTEKKKVCKKMFLSTLDVGEWMVRQYAKKVNGMNLPVKNKQTVGRNKKSTVGKGQVFIEEMDTANIRVYKPLKDQWGLFSIS